MKASNNGDLFTRIVKSEVGQGCPVYRYYYRGFEWGWDRDLRKAELALAELIKTGPTPDAEQVPVIGARYERVEPSGEPDNERQPNGQYWF